MGLPQEWYLQEIQNNDNEMWHRAMNEENVFWRAVSSGDLDYVRENCEQQRFSATEGVGLLSRDPVTNIKYHLVVTAALITRVCAESGMDLEQAFRLCDFYILKLDSLHNIPDIVHLHDQMVMDFTGKMRLLSKGMETSKPVTDCIEYIYTHITERVTVDCLADHTGMSPSHLSRLFKKETGVSISDYIRGKKMEKAMELLRFCDFSLIKIANYLAFSSQSHFTQMFREHTGMTPKKYRDCYRKKGPLTDSPRMSVRDV